MHDHPALAVACQRLAAHATAELATVASAATALLTAHTFQAVESIRLTLPIFPTSALSTQPETAREQHCRGCGRRIGVVTSRHVISQHKGRRCSVLRPGAMDVVCENCGTVSTLPR